MEKKCKKIKLFIIFFTISLLFSLISSPVFAATGTATVVYDSSISNGTGFYSKCQDHLESMGYNIKIYNKPTNTSVISYMKQSKIFVCGLHGGVGTIFCGGDTYIVPSSLNSDPYRAISNLSSNALSGMKLALIYSCEAGKPSKLGDLIERINMKGAKCAIGWSVTMYASEETEWNRLFFEKAKNDTIVESIRHADYWITSIKGEGAHDRMLKRNEKGDINATIY